MGFLELLIANTKMQLRNRSALFWNFLFPIIMMTLLGLVFGKGTAKLDIGLAATGKVTTPPIYKTLSTAFSKIKNTSLEKGKKGKLLAKLKEGDLDAVVVIGSAQPPNSIFPQASSYPQAPSATVLDIYYDPANLLTGNIVQGVVSSVVEGLNRKLSRSPSFFKVARHSVRTERLNYISFLLPGIIGMAVMFTGILGTAFPLANEREKGILRRLRITPLPIPTYIGAKAIGMVVIAFLQALLIILVGILFFSVKIVGSYAHALLVVFLGAITFVVLGFLVAGLAKKAESVDPIGNLIAMPMMFLGGVFFPVDQAPSWLQPLIKILPLTYFNEALRSILVKGESIFAVRFDVLALFIWTFGLFILAIRFFRWESRPG